MSIFLICLAFIGFSLIVVKAIIKISYINDHKIYKPGVKWPQWFIEDCESFNRKHPDKKVNIDSHR